MYDYRLPLYDNLKELAISNEDVKACVHSSLVLSDFWEVYADNYANVPLRAKEAGTQLAISYSLEYCLFFIRDFLVFVHEPNLHFKTDGSGKRWYEENARGILFIPLTKIKSIEIYKKNHSGFIPGKTITKQGNALKGAVIGAAIGGTTGAVIGAAAASRPKTTTIIHASSYNADYVRMKIEFVNRAHADIDLFHADLDRKRSYEEGAGRTIELNHVICGWTHDWDSISCGLINQLYENKLSELIENAIDFDEREHIITQIEKIYNVKLGLSKYSSRAVLSTTIAEKIDNEKLSPAVQRLISEHDSVIQQKEKLEQDKNDLKDILNSLSFFKISEKKKIQENISNLENEISAIDKEFDLYPTLRTEYATM